MTRPILVAALGLLALPAAVVAKPRLPPCPVRGPQLFLSPIGEPFRAGAEAPYPAAAWFVQADANHDGKLTRVEALADADRFFARLDRDRDGEITPPEIRIYEDEVAPEIRSQVGRGDPLAAPGPRVKRDRHAVPLPDGAGRWSFLPIPQPVIAADDDVNRAVTRSEFRAAMAKRFAQIAQAGVSTLTMATLPKSPMQSAAEALCATSPSAR